MCRSAGNFPLLLFPSSVVFADLLFTAVFLLAVFGLASAVCRFCGHLLSFSVVPTLQHWRAREAAADEVGWSPACLLCGRPWRSPGVSRFKGETMAFCFCRACCEAKKAASSNSLRQRCYLRGVIDAVVFYAMGTALGQAPNGLDGRYSLTFVLRAECIRQCTTFYFVRLKAIFACFSSGRNDCKCGFSGIVLLIYIVCIYG